MARIAEFLSSFCKETGKTFFSFTGRIGVDFKKRKKLVFSVLLGFLFLGVLVTIVSRYYRLGLGVTSSLPFYLFVVEPGVIPQRGEYVSFYTSGDLKPYYKEGIEFGKRVAGVQNDRLSVRGRDYYVNGMALATAKERDSQGRPVSQFLPLSCLPGKDCDVVIPIGKFFVTADHPMSYDSRYWGYVDISQVIGRLKPIF